MLDKNQGRHDKYSAEICYTCGEFKAIVIYAENEEYVNFHGLEKCPKNELFRVCDRCK